MDSQRRRLLLGCFATLGVLTTPIGLARGRRGISLPFRGLTQGSNYSGPVLSRQELRECVRQESTINDGSKEIDQMEASIEAKAQEIERIESLIEAREPLVDRYDQRSVDNFNELIRRHREMIESYNAKLSPINKEISAHQSVVDSFNQKCADHQYYERDMNAIRRGSYE